MGDATNRLPDLRMIDSARAALGFSRDLAATSDPDITLLAELSGTLQ